MMNETFVTYPYAYTSLRNQVTVIANNFSSTVLTLGNKIDSSVLFYNRPVLSAFNRPEKALDIFFNYKLKYGAKFIFGGEHFLFNGDVIADRSMNVVVYKKDDIIYYNTDVNFKRGMKTILDFILKSTNSGIVPMITPHINRFFYKQLPVFKFKSLKEQREGYRDISRKFLETKSTLFVKK